MAPAPMCAGMSALGFVPDEFEGDPASARDAIELFEKMNFPRRRGAPRKPGVLSWVPDCERGISTEGLSACSIDREMDRRWREAIAVAGPGELTAGRVEEGYAVLSAQIFAECVAVNEVAANDVDVAGYAMAIAYGIRRARWAQALSAAKVSPADELREIIAVVEAMPTFHFSLSALSFLSPATTQILQHELEQVDRALIPLPGMRFAHGLELPSAAAINVAGLGPLGIKDACQRALRKRILKPSRLAERDLVMIMAETFRMLSGGSGLRSTRGVDFFQRINAKLRPGLQVSAEWGMRRKTVRNGQTTTSLTTPRTVGTNMHTVRLPVTVVVDGWEYPPGTEVRLDADEAARLTDRFGTINVPGKNVER